MYPRTVSVLLCRDTSINLKTDAPRCAADVRNPALAVAPFVAGVAVVSCFPAEHHRHTAVGPRADSGLRSGRARGGFAHSVSGIDLGRLT